MGFLGDLADQLSDTFGLGENTNRSLDAEIDGQKVKYGALGDFAGKFDQSAERRYVEEGYLRRDPFNADPKQYEILMQAPSATVFIKKRMFSSIAENFRTDYMNADEKLYYKAIKILFANKCAQISALEKLSKIQSVSASAGSVSESLMPVILTISDTVLAGGFSEGSNLWGGFGGTPMGGADASKLINVTDQLRKIYSFNKSAKTTTWAVNTSDLLQSTFGQGTGVIELTNFNSLNTSCSVDSIKSPGTFSMNIVDPYNAMVITEWDIEKAISDATNMFKNSSVFQLVGKDGSDQVILSNQQSLNQIRSARGASPITIKVNPNTLLGKRVTAILDRTGTEIKFTYDAFGGFIGKGVKVDDDFLKGGAIAGNDGLDTDKVSTHFPGLIDSKVSVKKTSELDAFSSLITSIFSKLQLEQNSQNAFQIANKNTNYARRKMRFNFSGKLIIQPMDIVHIYMKTNSVWDNKLLGGLSNMFNGFGFVQELNTFASNFKSLTSLLNPSNSGSVQAEKAAYVGNDFPDYLWVKLRDQFVGEKEGVHVFAGVVDSANDSWSDGKFSISVSGRDNTVYFDQGKVNFKPGADSFNGAMFNPLTPFKSNFDTITSNQSADTPELLDENQVLLGTSKDEKSLVKAKSGPDAGKKVTSNHIAIEKSIDPRSGNIIRTFHAPDGLVYKWKEGIGVFVQFGSSLKINDPELTGDQTIQNNPFAGQDVMNVISLLITGTPYNYANYWRATVTSAEKDSNTQEDAAHTYIAGLKNELTKSNILWGNFVPFKNLVINEEAFAKAQQSQFNILNRNKSLDDKLKKFQALNDQAAFFNAGNALAEKTPQYSGPFKALQSQVAALRTSIDEDIKKINDEEAAFNAAAPTAGADASFNYADFIDSSKAGLTSSKPDLRRELRRQTNYLTRRMSYNVRANEDKNLFIVDDLYDKDYDLLAYENSLDSLKLYNNDFNSVRDKINNTADLLNLEVFADTQGHIRVRPPQYNRMPSSVFYRMMYLKKAYGVQVFPQFLDDLFVNQIDSLRKKIEIIEDTIRLDCAIVTNTTTGGDSADAVAKAFILDKATNNSGGTFNFISDPSGAITDITAAIRAATPDSQQADQVQTFISKLSGQATSNKEVFNNTARYNTIVAQLTKQNLPNAGYSIATTPAYNVNKYIDQLISRIQTKSGTKINKRDYLVTSASNNGLKVSIAGKLDIFLITEQLQKQLQERQKAIRLLFGAVSNAQEFKFLDSDSTSGSPSASNQLLSPSMFTKNSNIPEVFEHMLEDESYNDYGGNSSQRYVIKRAQIKSLNITETPPDYTMVQVQGYLDPNAPNALPQELNSFPDSGNGMVTAVAVDYDAWRNYGFKNQHPITVPFLTDPNTQCAPYASMILSRNRKNVLRGTLTISGNEYQQPGEVIYIEDRGLLFYVTAVRHSFGFGGSFTTTLDLSYGHTPGEYIPTVTDVIGKLIYNNRDIAGFSIQTQGTTANETNFGVVLINPNSSKSNVPGSKPPVVPPGTPNAPANSFSAANAKTLNNILFKAAYYVNKNKTDGNNVVAKLELRVYHDKANAVNNTAIAIANEALNYLTGKTSDNTRDVIGNPIDPKGGSSANKDLRSPPLPADSVKVVPVNLDKTTDGKSPSQKAIDSARNLAAQSSTVIKLSQSPEDETTPPVSNDKIRAALFSSVIDCWLTFESIPQKTTGGS